MWISATVAYIHYLSFMVAFGALVTEGLTLKKEPTLEESWRLVIADSIYGLSATAVLVTGVLRVMYFGKGTDYYLSHHIFFAKVGLFIVVGLLSLYPTFSFLMWIKTLRDRQAPVLEEGKVSVLQWLIRGELVGLALIPFTAALLARGL
jgi:putative membrane protein